MSQLLKIHFQSTKMSIFFDYTSKRQFQVISYKWNNVPVGVQQNVSFLDYQIDSSNFFGERVLSTSKSQFVSKSKLGGDSIMIF